MKYSPSNPTGSELCLKVWYCSDKLAITWSSWMLLWWIVSKLVTCRPEHSSKHSKVWFLEMMLSAHWISWSLVQTTCYEIKQYISILIKQPFTFSINLILNGKHPQCSRRESTRTLLWQFSMKTHKSYIMLPHCYLWILYFGI